MGAIGHLDRQMKKVLFITFVVFLNLFITSCASSGKRVIYLQERKQISPKSPIDAFDAKIMPKDLLTISVSTSDPEAAFPFNLIVPSTQTNENFSNLVSQPTLQNYLVTNQGEISFPILGTLKVGGLTTQQTSDLIIGMLKKYLKESPIVTVRLINYKISVIGEVNRPNVYTVPNEKINVMEALALAGDLTIYGKRNNVRIIREDAGTPRHIVSLDLTDANIIHSPYFYLQQNDIVYVEPNKAKTQSSNIGSSTNLLVSVTSILVSLAGLLVNVLR